MAETIPAAPVAHRLGPGSFKIGETGTPAEFGAQCTAMKASPSLSEEDAIPVLNGRELSGDDSIAWTIGGTLLQSFDKKGLIFWAMENSLKELPFVLDPSTENAEFTVEGICKVVPLELGGDVKKRNTTDFEFKVIGDPVFKLKPTGGA